MSSSIASDIKRPGLTAGSGIIFSLIPAGQPDHLSFHESMMTGIVEARAWEIAS